MVHHERSKVLRSGRSRFLPAWVRIPLLTFSPFILHSNCNQQSKITYLGECQDGRAVEGAAFRSQSGSPSVDRIPFLTFFPIYFTQ